MSILLRHADIPKYGHRIVILSDGHAYYEDFANPYVDLGEVVKVPPHGRLIDGDVAEGICFTEEDENGKDFCDGILYAADWISKQPTIIPADRRERDV